MILSFKNRALAELWAEGTTRKIDTRMHDRIQRRLDALHQADRVSDMDVPGFNFHALRGHRPTRYTVHVNGPWCITFEFRDGHAHHVDFEQYH